MDKSDNKDIISGIDNSTKKKNDLDSSNSSLSSPSYSPNKKNKRSLHSHSSGSSSSWSLDKHKNINNNKKFQKKDNKDDDEPTQDVLIKKRKRSSSSSKKRNSEPKKYSDYKDKISIPGFDGPLITESLFKKLQHDSIPADIVNETYKEYKEKYEKKKMESFFIEHENDEWFKEKYNPETFTANFEQSKLSSAKLSLIFKEKIDEYKLNINLSYNPNIGFKNVKFDKFVFQSISNNNINSNNTNNNSINVNKNGDNSGINDTKNKKLFDFGIDNPNTNKGGNSKEEIKEFSQLPYYGFDPDKNTLFIHQVPKSLSKLQIYEISQKTPGYLYISLSEPIKSQNYNRYCWLTFNTEENCNKSYELLKDYKIGNEFKLSPVKSKSSLEKIIKVSPSLYENRINEDLLNTKKIIKIFDEDKNLETLDIFTIKTNPDNNKTNNNNNNEDGSKDDLNEDTSLSLPKEEKIKLLDLQILYLRKVHGFCFYCFEGHEDERILSTKCDNVHLRLNYIGKRGEEIFDSIEKENEINLYDKILTEKIEEFLKKGKIEHFLDIYDINKDETLQKQRKKFAFENNTKVATDRFQCDFCGKLFRGVEFVVNHIINKHVNVIKDKVDKKHSDKLKKENFMNDTKKNYEKIKVISDMDEYFNYLNAMKKYQNYEFSGSSNRKYHSNRENKERDNRESNNNHNNKYSKRSSYYRDYDDYESGRKNNHSYNNNNQSSTGRKLISYEDL